MTLEDDMAKLPPAELVVLRWELQRREAQIAPDPLPPIWLLLGGRNAGKTYTGSNHIFQVAKTIKPPPGKPVRVALISETLRDVKSTMIEGDSGLRSIIPESMELAWNRSMGEYKIAIKDPYYREIHFFSFSSETPEQLRGPQFHLVWIDEPAKLKDANKSPMDPSTTWSNMRAATRLGSNPHILITGTPEPHKLIRYLTEEEGDCTTTVMPSLDNWENMPESYRKYISSLPTSSRLYQQEVMAKVLIDNPNSIIKQDWIDLNRGDPDMDEVTLVLGYDPAMTANPESDEAGIVLGGFIPAVKERGEEVKSIQGFLLEDYSGHHEIAKQVQIVCDLIIDKWIPEVIIEKNQGSDFVLNNVISILKANNSVKDVFRRKENRKTTKAGTIDKYRVAIMFKDGTNHTFRMHAIHAKMNKALRADSIAIHYEMGNVHHPTRGLPVCDITSCKSSIEDQMVLWDASKTTDSPDRMDAAVYVLLHIFGAEHALSNRRPAKIHSTINVSDLPKYDPRSVLTEPDPKKMNKTARIYTMDVGGFSGNESGTSGLAGPR